MGTFSQGITLHSAGTATGSATSLSHRSSLKAPAQVRWPVNLNQLAALSLDDDSDLDRSFSDVSRDEIGSVKLLRMLKDSDDESTALASSQSRLRGPRLSYSSSQTTQQKQQLQQSHQGGSPIARSTSLQGVHGYQSGTNSNSATNVLRPPQRRRSDNKGSSPATVLSKRPTSLRHHQSDLSLASTRRQVGIADRPENMGHIFSETNVIAQKSRTSGVPQHDKIASGLRGPSYKSGTDTTPSSSPSALRKPGTISSPLSSSSSIPSPALQPRSRLSVPSKLSSLPSTGTISGLKQRSPAPATVIGMGPDLRQRESLSPPRLSSSSGPSRKITGLQQSPLSRPMTLNHHAMGNQSTTAIVSASPSFSFAQEITAENDGESDQMILKLTEELDRYRIELETYKQERVVADKMKKQISDLERDLETALDSLQTAEAKVIEADSQQQAVDSRISDFEKMIEGLKADLNMEKLKAEKALGDAAASQKQKLQELEIRNRELETKLTQAQDEIDQLELQVVPAELQDVHQSLFSATQELDEEKKRCEKLRTELAEEKAKIAREQEDSGQLLVKISQLQDTIANHIRDNNALKEVVKEHEKCQENAEVADHQYKKEVVRLQDEISIHQQSLTEEREQRSRVEQALQEQQYQSHQLQQQIQLQQTQLHQQQTEIVNLRASLEVEQRQTVLLQQKLQEEQRLNSQYGRRVSIDGDLNGSFLMVENNANGSNGINVGATPVVMTASSDIPLNMIGNNNMVSPGPGHPLSSSGPFSSMTTTATSLATGIQPIRGFDASSSSSSLLSNQINASSAQSGVQAAALPPMAPAMTHGGMATSVAGIATPDIEAKPGMIHRGSSSSITGIIANGNVGNNRLSLQDSLGSAGSSATTSGAAVAVGMQTIEELTTQLQHLIKEKERLQADLSKIPISGGGPMTRRKADMLEEQMDKTERAISKIRLNIRMQS